MLIQTLGMECKCLCLLHVGIGFLFTCSLTTSSSRPSFRYNDHHFHYGYHISAAAIVAKHRPQWGVKYFERILLYIRDIANPSADDEFFPMYRQKDWYLGNSYAAGLVSSELLYIYCFQLFTHM